MLFALGWALVDEPKRLEGTPVENYATAGQRFTFLAHFSRGDQKLQLKYVTETAKSAHRAASN